MQLSFALCENEQTRELTQIDDKTYDVVCCSNEWAIARAGSMSRLSRQECAKQGCKYDYAEKAEANSDAEAWSMSKCKLLRKSGQSR